MSESEGTAPRVTQVTDVATGAISIALIALTWLVGGTLLRLAESDIRYARAQIIDLRSEVQSVKHDNDRLRVEVGRLSARLDAHLLTH